MYGVNILFYCKSTTFFIYYPKNSTIFYTFSNITYVLCPNFIPFVLHYSLQFTVNLYIPKKSSTFALDYKITGIIYKNILGIMLIEKIGENAGAIWNALQGGALTTKALKKATKLKEADLNLALGWLARENKIAFEVAEKDITVSLL